MKSLLAAAFALAALCGQAQTPERPKVYALVSAIGGDISVVRQRADVGSNLEPYRRYTVHMPDASVDMAVLRGLDRAVASEDPDSTRVFLRMDPEQVRGVLPYKRGEVVPARAIAALEMMPERKDWDRIILVTPRWLQPGRDGMGTKLHGIGIYIQPLGRNIAGILDADAGIETAMDPDTASPTGEKGRSYKYVAPYFYAQMWVLDAKTMKVLETNERYDFQRLYDPNSTAIDVAKQIPVEQLATLVERFVERAAAQSLNDPQGEVIIKEHGPVNPGRK